MNQLMTASLLRVSDITSFIHKNSQTGAGGSLVRRIFSVCRAASWQTMIRTSQTSIIRGDLPVPQVENQQKPTKRSFLKPELLYRILRLSNGGR